MEIEEQDDFTPRDYQIQIAEIALKKNTIIYLPTGSGKTFIAVLILKQLSHPLQKPISQNGKISVMLVNTVTLVDQQAKSLRRCTQFEVAGYSGDLNVDFWDKSRWLGEFEKYQVLVMTSQIFLNLLQATIIKFENVNLIIFDECHTAVSDHPMRQIMANYRDLENFPRIVGLTATLLNKNCSPQQACSEVKALEITLQSKVATVDDWSSVIEFSTNPCKIIKVFEPPVIQNTVHQVLKDLQDLKSILCCLEDVIEIDELSGTLSLPKLDRTKGLKNITNLIEDTRIHIQMLGAFGGKLAVIAHIIQLERLKKHCQDIKMLTIFDAIITKFIISKKKLDNIMASYTKLEQIFKFSSDHVLKLFDILKEFSINSKEELCGIVFVQRRFTAKVVYNILKSLKEADSQFEYLNVNFVVGMNTNPFSDTREGLYNIKMHRKVLSEFKNKEINLLVSSNVLEEGVDIPMCTLVVIFDIHANYRSYIQTKGRARHKNSFYYMLIKKEEEEKFYNNYTKFLEIENILTNYIVASNEMRVGPSKKEIEYFTDENLSQAYFSEGPGSAQVTMLSAIALLCRYCATLPADKYTSYVPHWYVNTKGPDQCKLCQVVIEMPIICPIVDPIEGSFMPNKKNAKRSAALQACVLLHQFGELDNMLQPKPHDVVDENVTYYFMHWPTIQEKDAGNTKKRRTYSRKVPKAAQGVVIANKIAYLHIIELHPIFSLGNVTLNMLNDLYQSELCFGFVSAEALPDLCEFSLYVTAGEIKVNIKNNYKTVVLSEDELVNLRNFHCLVFRDVLGVLKSFLVFNNQQDHNVESFIVVPLSKENDIYNINFDVVLNNKELMDQKAEPNDVDKLRLNVSTENYLGKIVTPWYRADDKQYLVIEVCADKTGLSNFPSDEFATYATYFHEKYDAVVLNSTQPLLLVKGLSKKQNCLKPRHLSLKRTREKVYEEFEEHLIAELCVKQDFPAALWIQANLLPSVFYRILSLLQAEELRTIIAKESGLGSTRPKIRQWQPLLIDNLIFKKKGYVKSSTTEKNKASEVDVPNEGVTLPPTKIVNSMALDFSRKKLNSEYPWLEKEEPIDISRNWDITLMDIQYYESFISEKVVIEERVKRNDIQNSKPHIPALTYDKEYVQQKIKLFETNRNSDRPELVEIYKALTTAKSNDIVNLERLETLGDSFLKFSISLFIILKYPQYDEGKATAFKGRLISNKNLYYVGIAKGLGEYLKVLDFAPDFEWKPPAFRIPQELLDKSVSKSICRASLFYFAFTSKEQGDGNINKDSKNNIINYQEEEMDDVDETAYDTMNIFLDMQTVYDKTIADSVEALLGVYFQSYGLDGGLRFLEWLGVVPKSEKIVDLFKFPLPNPILNYRATSEMVDFHIPGWKKLEEALGYHFSNRSYLLQALTHASYSMNRVTNCYQTLEFLGDAILDFLITCHIFEKSEHLDPGQLTDLRSALVNNVTFACFTVRCGFHKFILSCNSQLMDYIENFVEHQEMNGFVINDEVLILLEEGDLYLAEHVDVPKVLGDVFEALAGAVFLDSGMKLDVVWSVFHRIMWKEIELFSNQIPKNPVRLIHETAGAHPKFQKVKEVNADRSMIGLDFMLDGAKKTVYGFGENKNLAKKAAAKIALRLLQS